MTVAITSTPANGTHYVAGEAITTRISLEATIGTTLPLPMSASRMALDIGGVTRQAAVTAADATTIQSGIAISVVDFTYTVVAADLDADGVSIPENSISGTNWRTWTGQYVPLDRDHAALPAQSAHQVVGPAASITSTTPAVLTEGNLNGATVAVAVNVGFEIGVTTASFELVTTMTGVTIDSVSSVSSGDTSATLTLASTADIAATATLAVKVLAAAHASTIDLTTGAVTVAPVLTVGSGASTSGAFGAGLSRRWAKPPSRRSLRGARWRDAKQLAGRSAYLLPRMMAMKSSMCSQSSRYSRFPFLGWWPCAWTNSRTSWLFGNLPKCKGLVGT